MLQRGGPILQELNEYQDAGVNVARLVSGLAVAVAGGDVDTAALTGGNAAQNNALCGGLCIGVIAAIIGYTTYSGDGDPLEGLAVIGSGDDPLGQAVAAGTSAAVEWSATEYPEQTAAVLDVVEATGEAIDATITYVDDATGNKVSRRWNEIPEHTRNQIKGGAKIASIFVPAGSIKALKQLRKTRKLSVEPERGKPGSYTSDRTLPTDKHGVPLPDSDLPHTQLGRSKPKYGSEPQAREWGYGSNGNLQPKRDIDFTDHGYPDAHPHVPHQHTLTPNNPKLAPKGGYQRGPGEPL